MQTIRNLFAHLDWANRELLEALRAAPAEKAEKASILFLHVLLAERIWLTRLRGESSEGLSVWEDHADPAACAALIEANGSGFRAWLDALPEDRIDKPIAYRTIAGAPFESSPRDILIHVALHGQYHRGQINAALRAGGVEPAAVDYILYARLGTNV
ncbi:DinB family protein [Paenibacillus caseinilyticus]|uniref:DNA damage-inducible protein DinB n=1 Tax=Paenibacillus mucilaginosus K02 TaxID=997761 RepID=I0BDC4_9BACL|nr:DinB family protein [Paenibacillus mucilaginosus]AFH60371.1 DNA damage-inducible protein DinB [Paenibacillus mucilaginosus K02]